MEDTSWNYRKKKQNLAFNCQNNGTISIYKGFWYSNQDYTYGSPVTFTTSASLVNARFEFDYEEIANINPDYRFTLQSWAIVGGTPRNPIYDQIF